MFSRFLPVNSTITSKNDPTNAYVDPSLPDSTGYYTLAGTKLMARASFDFKPLFKSFADQFLGPNDLRIYSEAAILGLKNYPVYYDDLSKRIPIMVGFNVPTFKVFDVLALEVENYNWNYSNGYQNPVWYGIAVSGQALQAAYTEDDYNKDNLKLPCMQNGHSFAISAFCSSLQTIILFYLPTMKPSPTARKYAADLGPWYWLAKFGVNF